MSFFANILMGDCAASRKIVQPILNFGLRFYVAFTFFKSGLTKVDDKFQVTDNTLYYFEELTIPLLPYDIAAYLATYAELILPILLVIGLLTRFAAFALFILNAVATYAFFNADFRSSFNSEGASIAVEFLKHPGDWQHIVWGVILVLVFAYGPSKISIDSWVADKLRGKDSSLLIKLIGIIILSGICFIFFSGIGYDLFNK